MARICENKNQFLVQELTSILQENETRLLGDQNINNMGVWYFWKIERVVFIDQFLYIFILLLSLCVFKLYLWKILKRH